jgi:hypothetical protein
MWHVWGRAEMHTKLWLGDLRERPLGRPRHRWEDKMNLQEVGWGDMDWIYLAQDRER